MKVRDDGNGRAHDAAAKRAEFRSIGPAFIFNSTQDAMFLAEYVDGEFRYLRINSAHRRISGLENKNIQEKRRWTFGAKRQAGGCTNST